MLNDNLIPKYIWTKALNIARYLQNKIYIRSILKKNLYELWKGWKPNISYFHPFACKCFILNTKDNLEKFDSKSDNGTFLGYFETSKAFRVYSSRTLAVEETIHLKFNENEPDNDLSKLDESFADLRLDDAIKKKESSNQSSEVRVSTHHLDDPQEEVREPTGCFIRRNHPESQIIGDLKYHV